MTFMLVLFLSLFGARFLWAHEGHTHVMGTVTAMSDSELIVNNKSGQTIAIPRDRNTRYRTTGVATSNATVRVGDRVVVEVTEESNSLRAADVRYTAVAPRKP
jgi:hypothetical protein